MPCCFFASGSVRTRQKIQSAYCASVVQVFWPLTTYSSPSRTAVVFSDARSEPALGSEKPWHHQMSRLAVLGRNRCFSSSLPKVAITGPTMAALKASGGGHVRERHLLGPEVALHRRPVLPAPLDRPVRHRQPVRVQDALGGDEVLPGEVLAAPRPWRGSPPGSRCVKNVRIFSANAMSSLASAISTWCPPRAVRRAFTLQTLGSTRARCLDTGMPRRTPVLITAVAVAVGFLPVVAASAAPSTIGSANGGDPYFPQQGNGGYDVKHYSLQLRYTPRTAHLVGTALVRAVARQALTRFDLDLRHDMSASSVTVNGLRARHLQPRGSSHELIITPAHRLTAGRRVPCRRALRGHRAVGHRPRRLARRLDPDQRRGVRRRRAAGQSHLVPGQQHPARQGDLRDPGQRAARVHGRLQRHVPAAGAHRSSHHLALPARPPGVGLPGDRDRRPVPDVLRQDRQGRAVPDLRRPAGARRDRAAEAARASSTSSARATAPIPSVRRARSSTTRRGSGTRSRRRPVHSSRARRTS